MWKQRRKDEGNEKEEENDKQLTCKDLVAVARQHHIIQVSAHRRQRITYDADAGLCLELGRIGLQHSFLRVMHVPFLQSLNTCLLNFFVKMSI